MKLTYNQLLIFSVLCCIGWVFTLGMSYHSMFTINAENKRDSQEISKLQKEKQNLQIEVQGLIRLMKIKDEQSVCHYTHREIKHDFRIINKR